MKKVSILSLIALVAIVVSSCGSSNSVVNNNRISKRKYTKGFFFQRNSNFKTANTKVEDDKLKGDESVAKVEKVEAKKSTSVAKEAKKKSKRTNNVVESSEVATNEGANSNYYPSEEEEVPETRQFEAEGSDGIESSVIENHQSARSESTEEASSENRSEPLKKKKNNQGNGQEDVIFILAVIFAILIPPLGVAIYTNIDWIKVLIALLLTILFFLPGMIYALLVVFDVI